MNTRNAFLEITTLTKSGGPLTKRIKLKPDGTLLSDGSTCLMSRGAGRRERFATLTEFADHLAALTSSQAIALGALVPSLPDVVEITSKAKLRSLNGAARPDIITRTSSHISYQPGRQAFALLDFDTKGMTADVAARIVAAGGFWQALLTVYPDLAGIARVTRVSTSSGLYRTDTGAQLAGSSGIHVFLLLADGEDANRFLQVLHSRCWLAGLGWMMIGAGGQMLERSIVDRMVGMPERLVFEGPPILEQPLAQDLDSRRPVVVEGAALDTVAAFPPLTILEKSKLRELQAKAIHRLSPEAAKSREDFVTAQSQRLTERTGTANEKARHIVARQCSGVLLPDVVLPFDDEEYVSVTVADVLANPRKFEGATLADPVEGIEYGSCKAKVMLRADGTPWIHSFAHGRTTYELKHDAAAVSKALEGGEPHDAVETLVKLSTRADLQDDDAEALRNLAAKLAGVGKRAIDRRLKEAEKQKNQERKSEERTRRAAERHDPRPQIDAPEAEAPWIPQMQLLNEVLGGMATEVPPMRDLEGYIIQVRTRTVSSMHGLTSTGINDGDASETRLPPPEMPLLTRLDDAQVAELIERHIDYTNLAGESVHLHGAFVKHYTRRHDGALPIATAVATLPIVLPDGTILSGRGLDACRGVVFRVPQELQELLPAGAACKATNVANAMRFLTDEWMADVASSYTGKCVLIALALTIIERLILPERPAFFVTAGQRGGGKTTTLNMISMAVLGSSAGAAAWSPNDEERRKALLAYLSEGVPLIAWDNIPRGAAISCPSIEKALTAETYVDRVLGVSDTRTVPATAVQVFTGNNVGPRGDMTSRSLTARLEVKRPDPENRNFKHADVLAWTEANRGKILAALFTVLLGNPRLRAKSTASPETRFKTWWHLVGAAVEHAAAEHKAHVDALVADGNPYDKPAIISFKKLFLDGEVDDEQTSNLAIVLKTIRERWSAGATSSVISTYAGQADEASIEFKSALEQASGKAIKVVSPTVIAWRLKSIQDAPVQISENAVWTLKYTADSHGGTFSVRASK